MTIGAQMHDHVMTVAQVSAKVFYYEPKPFVDAFEAVAAYYNMDTVMPFADVYNYEAEALGQKMIYSDDAMPTIDFRQPLIAKPGDLGKIKIPDWAVTKRVPYVFEATRLSLERGLSTQGTNCAPFSLAVGTRSYPLLVRDMKRDPAFAHELFTWLVDEVLTSYMVAYQKYTGVNIILPADAWAAYPLLTPQLLEEWVVPYNQRLQANLMPHGIFMVSMAGDYNEEDPAKFDKEILWQLYDIQAKLMGMPTAFMAMGRTQDYPIEAVAEYADRKRAEGVEFSITMGVNARLLRDGPVTAIVDTIKRFIDVVGRRAKLDLFLANIPADAPPDHIHAAVAAVHTYGKLPLADNLDDIPFTPPKRETFQEFMAQRAEG
jgi:uroporphyrinogen-III decarboxylase